MLVKRSDGYGNLIESILKTAKAKEIYAKVADGIKEGLEIEAAISEIISSMIKIAEKEKITDISKEDLIVSIDKLSSKNYQIKATPAFINSRIIALKKEAQVKDWIGNTGSQLAQQVGHGAEEFQKGYTKGLEKAKNWWEKLKGIPGKAIQAPLDLAKKVEEKSKSFQQTQYEEAMNVYQLALKEAIDSYQMVREWLDDPSKNRISIPQFKEFVSKLQNLQSAVSNVSSRKPVAVEPRQVVQEPIPVSPASLSSKPAKPQIPTVSNNEPIPMKPFEFTRQQQR